MSLQKQSALQRKRLKQLKRWKVLNMNVDKRGGDWRVHTLTEKLHLKHQKWQKSLKLKHFEELKVNHWKKFKWHKAKMISANVTCAYTSIKKVHLKHLKCLQIWILLRFYQRQQQVKVTHSKELRSWIWSIYSKEAEVEDEAAPQTLGKTVAFNWILDSYYSYFLSIFLNVVTLLNCILFYFGFTCNFVLCIFCFYVNVMNC